MHDDAQPPKDPQTLQDGQRTLFFPFHCVPVEILQDIFLHSVLDGPSILLPRRTTTPWSLTRVSSIWRQAALTFPWLWSTLTLPHDYEKSKTTCNIPNALREVLYHSKTVPLDIDFSSISHELLHILASCSSRWRTLSLTINSGKKSDKDALISLIRLANEVPMLERLVINDTFGQSIPSWVFGSWLRNARRLRHVVIPTIPDAGIFLPCDQLCTFHWERHPSLEMEVLLLNRLSNLEKLPALPRGGSFRDDVTWEPTSSVIFRQVKALSLHDGVCERYLQCLSLPSLTDVRLTAGLRTEPTLVLPALVSLLRRSSPSCNLLNLFIEYGPSLSLREHDLSELLQLCPFVQNLHVGLWQDGRGLGIPDPCIMLRVLDPGHGKDISLPRLKTLSFAFHSISMLPLELTLNSNFGSMLVQNIHSRCTTLKAVRLKGILDAWWKLLGLQENSTKLEMFRVEGMCINITRDVRMQESLINYA